jgi:ATP-binding cassette subfamily B protein
MANAMTPGSLVVFISYIRFLYGSLRSTLKQIIKLTKAGAQLERVVELLEEKPGVVDRPDARPAPRFRGDLVFRGVSFEYEPGLPVLSDIDFTAPAGRVTALVGPTGSGKTTLVSLITRLFDPTAGEILIDGQDIRAWTLQSLRAQISVVLQESVLVQASIAENIAYGRPSASFAEIEAAARAANAHEFIQQLPGGYETVVGERGETLSGGQRQRIAIARALVRNAPIVILDEPLTGLDAATAASVTAALERLMAHKTVLIITHHFSTIQHADQIVVLAGGRIVQRGSHPELVAADGSYRQLFERQFSDALAPARS